MSESLPDPCQRCGRPNSVRRGRKYCSMECAGTARTRPARLPCAHCGKPFAPKKPDIRFCSRECAARSRRNRASLTCDTCGAQFEVPQSAASRGGRFCSRECADERGWQHGTLTGYTQKKCRCDSCVERGRQRGREYRERLREVADEQPDKIPHGALAGYVTWGCRCEKCRVAKNEKDREYAERHPDRVRTRARKVKARINAETQVAATNARKEWTGPELELVASRTDLTLVQLAEMLGRSYAAVQCARQRVRHDPKWTKVAGVARP